AGTLELSGQGQARAIGSPGGLHRARHGLPALPHPDRVPRRSGSRGRAAVLGWPGRAVTALLALMVALLPWFQGGGSADGLALAHTLILIACGAALVLAVRSGRLALTSGWEAVWGLGLVALAVASF